MFEQVTWINKGIELRGFISKSFIVGDRQRVDVLFENGKWFNNISYESLSINKSFLLTDKVVSQQERTLWLSRVDTNRSFVFALSFDVKTMYKGENRVLSNVVYVEASDSDIAIDTALAWLSDKGFKGTKNDFKHVGLSNCQLSLNGSKVIKAS